MKVVVASGVLALAFLSPRPSEACSIHANTLLLEEPETRVEAQLAVRQFGFAWAGITGDFTELSPSVRYFHSQRWVAGFNGSLIILRLPSGTRTGFANPGAFGEYRRPAGAAQLFAFGLQADFPLGNADKGMASGHFMLTPYGSWAGSFSRLFMNAGIGASMATGANPGPHSGHQVEGSEEGHLFVRPHESLEMIYRFSTGMHFRNRKLNPEVGVSVQHVLSEDRMHGEGDFYPVAVANLPLKMGRSILTARLEMPLNDAGRIESGLGIGLATGIL